MPFILVREHNAYDQYGQYYIAVWQYQPTPESLALVLANDNRHSRKTAKMVYDANPKYYDKLADWVIRKGGRQKNEEIWYTLLEEKFEDA